MSIDKSKLREILKKKQGTNVSKGYINLGVPEIKQKAMNVKPPPSALFDANNNKGEN